MQSLSGMSTKQKVTAGLIVVILLVIIWQIKGMFGGSSPSPKKTPDAKPGTAAMSGRSPSLSSNNSQNIRPKPAELPQQQPRTVQDAQMMRLQEATQLRYMQAVNELQLLKVAKDIAEANKAISSAKLSRVESEKKIVDLLVPPTELTPQQQLAGTITKIPPPPPKAAPSSQSQEKPAASYSVISVSQLKYQWHAVLNHKGKLYTVRVGDVLPFDGSRVVSINKSGVTLEREGEKDIISLVPTI